MKAAYFEQFGGPDVLKYGDLPDPVAAPGEVRRRCLAASVNAADWKFRAGQYPNSAKSNSRRFPDAIFPAWSARSATASTISKSATRCSACSMPAAKAPIAKRSRSRPRSSPRSPTRCRTSTPPPWRSPVSPRSIAIETRLKLKRGETILIQGGAGGVASFAIQLAKHIGAHVITTTSAANMRLCAQPRRRRGHRLQRAGFHQSRERLRRRVRYRRRRRGAEILRGAQAGRPRRLHRLRRAGAEARSQRRDLAAAGGGRARARRMERIAQLVAAGAVRPPEIKLYRLSQAAEAHRLSESRHFRGKLVFQVR